MKTRIVVCLILAFAISFSVLSSTTVSSASQRQSLIAPVVVEVNGEPIYEAELLYFLIGRSGQDVLGDLIQDAILAQQADEFGISLEPDHAKTEMTKYFGEERFANLKNVFDLDKVSKAIERNSIAEMVYEELIKKLIQDKELSVSQDDKLRFYLENLEDWSRPPLVKFSIIKADTREDANAALSELNNGVSFADVAGKYSTHEMTKNKGGDIGPAIPRNTFPGAYRRLEDLAFELPENTFSDIVVIENAYFIVMPTRKLPEVEKKFPEVESYIEGFLKMRMVEPYVDEALRDLRQNAKIEILYPVFDLDESELYGFTKVEKLPQAFEPCLIYPTVVRVNDEPITEQEMLFFLLIGSGQSVLQELIGDAAVSQSASELGVTVDSTEPDNVLNQTFGVDKVKDLEKTFDMDKIRHAIKREILARKAVHKMKEHLVKENEITVSDDDALRWYNNNVQRYHIPERVRFSIIVNDKEGDINKAYEEIKSGKDFGEVAMRYSIDDKTKDDGGDIGTLWPKGIFYGPFTELEDKIFALKKGEVSEIIFIQDRFYLVEVSEKVPAEIIDFEDVKEEIQELLVFYQVYPHLQNWLNSITNDIQLDVKYPVFKIDETILVDTTRLAEPSS